MRTNLLDRAIMIITGLLLLALSGPGMAGVYKCVDAKQRTFYQDKPCQEMTAARLPNSLSKIAGEEESRAFFWKASNDKGTLYLLGSLHFGAPSLFPLPQLVNNAFNHADVLVVEADINNQAGKDMALSMAGKGRYADNSKLEDHIKKVTWNKTVELANQLGLDEESLHPLKPWLAALALTAQSLVKEGFNPELGIDKTLLQQAQGKKPVMELESVEDQINLFDQFSDQEQEQVLLFTLQELTHGRELHQSIVNAWKKGDAEAMDLIVRQSFDSSQLGAHLMKVFLLDRNERMANSLQNMANDGRTYFAVIGAGHLGGEKGILKLLEQKGFTITQP